MSAIDPDAVARYEQQRKNREAADRLDAAGVPLRHRQRRQFDNPKWQHRRDRAIERIDGGAMVALLGKPGTGKTQIGVEAIKYAALAGKSALYIRAAEMFMAVREAYGPLASQRERDILKRFVKPWLLVIDDLHERSKSEPENRLLFLILDNRYGSMLPTILCANQSPDELKENIGGPTFDRLDETGAIGVCDWPSFRAGGGASATGGGA